MLGSASMHQVRNLEGSKNKELFSRAIDMTEEFMGPAFGRILGSFEVRQNSGELGSSAVAFGRLSVAWFGHGNLPRDRLASGPPAVCFQKSKTCVHSSPNAPGRFQPSPKFFRSIQAKTSTWPTRKPDGFGCFQQIAAHLGSNDASVVAALPNPLRLPLAWHLPRHPPKTGLARKGE